MVGSVVPDPAAGAAVSAAGGPVASDAVEGGAPSSGISRSMANPAMATSNSTVIRMFILRPVCSTTEALRSKLRIERGEPGLFDFGGSIEEIKARCKAETHLDPPAAPTFARAG